MQATVEPGNISGIITAPSSKSMTQRAYAAALLHHGKTSITNVGNSDDEQAALQIIQQLGAHVQKETPLTITGTDTTLQGAGHLISCGESGLAARLFTPIAALSNNPIKIEGTRSLMQRPMNGFEETMKLLNVTLNDFNGYLPFIIQGPMQARSITIDASAGSQFLSGLLFALSSCANEPIVITVTDLKSKPYIDMTLDMLARFGKPISHNNYKEFYIDPSKFVDPETVVISIEADWSSAAYFLVAGAIAGDITIRNLSIDSAQADKVIMGVLRDASAEISINDNAISIKRSRLKPFEFDATDCPDLFPVLSILAACCDGESYIKGVHRLFHKESNRAESISEMLQNFDVPFSLEDDSFCITGVRKLQGTVIDTYGDHRIAMSAAVAALRTGSRTDIKQAECVSKSYPAFFDDLILCGGRCKFEI